MRNLAILSVAAVLLLSLASRYETTFETGLPPSHRVIRQEWTPAFLGGLVSPSTEAMTRRCPYGIARIETRISTANLIVTVGSLGLYSPLSISITCARRQIPRILLPPRPARRPLPERIRTPLPPLPRPPRAQEIAEEVLFEENFNAENGGLYQLNYIAFAQWDVVEGSVDLIGTPPFHDFLPPAYGLHVDLDGTTRAGGKLQTKRIFVLEPGVYELEYELAGCPRISDPNTVEVALAGVYREQIRLENFTPVRGYRRRIEVHERTSGRLSFEHFGGDNYGILLDNVKLTRLRSSPRSTYALRLDGAGSYVQVADAPALDIGRGDFTWELWIRRERTGIREDLLDKKDLFADSEHDLALLIDADDRAVAFFRETLGRTPAVYLPSQTRIGTEWTHLAMTRRDGLVTLYVNGAAEASATVTYDVSSSGPLRIGANRINHSDAEAPAVFPFAGSIEELRLWRTARTGEQIRNSASSLIAPGTPGLVAYYRFDEGSEDLARDWTGNGHTGARRGTATRQALVAPLVR